MKDSSIAIHIIIIAIRKQNRSHGRGCAVSDDRFSKGDIVASSSQHPETAVLDWSAAVARIGLSGPAFAEFVELSLRDIDEAVTALGERIEISDLERTERVAHTLKGTAAGIGADRLRDVAFSLESAARSRKPRAVRSRHSAVLAEWAVLKRTWRTVEKGAGF